MQAPLPFDAPPPESDTRNPEPATRNPDPEIPTLFVRHPRARRYVIRVTDEGIVRVTIPRWGSKREGSAFVGSQRAWIERQLAGLDARPAAAVDRAVDREAWARAKRELPPRLRELADRHGLSVARVSIRNQQWRWGSCSPNGHICLNWRLVTMPPWVRDYVLIHELMHLRRLDHSPKFWKLVAAACPAYQDARAWLRHEGRQRLKTRP